ncbi:MAG: hypothetical protein M1546_27520 [Chloroflexi bacterium]|nr:hypothetical protein [Chloroflexota bacterium]
MELPRKYRGLRWVGVVATLAAWLVLVVCVVALLFLVPSVSVEWARWLLFGSLVLLGVSTFLQLFVKGNVLLLLNDLELQARANSAALDRITSMLEPAKSTVTPVVAEQTAAPEPAASVLPASETTQPEASQPTVAPDTAPSEGKRTESETRTA